VSRSAEIFEAMFRGLAAAIIAADREEQSVPRETKVRKKGKKRERASVPSQPSLPMVARQIPMPGFDPAGEESDAVPGFEGLPRATLAEMEEAMNRIARGNAPPPGFYDPNEDAEARSWGAGPIP
jgi:hypothetical protein